MASDPLLHVEFEAACELSSGTGRGTSFKRIGLALDRATGLKLDEGADRIRIGRGLGHIDQQPMPALRHVQPCVSPGLSAASSRQRRTALHFPNDEAPRAVYKTTARSGQRKKRKERGAPHA